MDREKTATNRFERTRNTTKRTTINQSHNDRQRTIAIAQTEEKAIGMKASQMDWDAIYQVDRFRIQDAGTNTGDRGSTNDQTDSQKQNSFGHQTERFHWGRLRE